LEENDPTSAVVGAEAATKYVEQRVAQLGAVWLVAQSTRTSRARPRSKTGAEAQVLTASVRGTVRKCLSLMPDAEREVLQAIYFEAKSCRRYVQGRDVSRSWACRLHAQGVAAVSEALGGGWGLSCPEEGAGLLVLREPARRGFGRDVCVG
jgi:hypothetical protein